MNPGFSCEPEALVSVVIPMRNAADFIERALHSILQEYDVPLDVVVVDDGSTDRSREVIAAIGDSRVRVVAGPEKGIAACMNVGIANARADIVMRCDADDAYPEGRIARQYEWLMQHPAVDAVAGAFSTIDASGAVLARVAHRHGPAVESIDAELRRGVTRTHLCTFAIRRRVFEKIGGFREFFEMAEDVDFQLRMGEACSVSYVPQDAYLYRLHGASITHSRNSQRRIYFDDMAIRLQKDRLASGSDALMRGEALTPPLGDGPLPNVRSHVHGMLIGQSWRDVREGQHRVGLRRALQAISVHPTHIPGWTNFIKILFRAIFPK